MLRTITMILASIQLNQWRENDQAYRRKAYRLQAFSVPRASVCTLYRGNGECQLTQGAS